MPQFTINGNHPAVEIARGAHLRARISRLSFDVTKQRSPGFDLWRRQAMEREHVGRTCPRPARWTNRNPPGFVPPAPASQTETYFVLGRGWRCGRGIDAPTGPAPPYRAEQIDHPAVPPLPASEGGNHVRIVAGWRRNGINERRWPDQPCRTGQVINAPGCPRLPRRSQAVATR